MYLHDMIMGWLSVAFKYTVENRTN